LKDEARDRTLWRTLFGRFCGPVVRQITELVNRRNYRHDFTIFLWYLFRLRLNAKKRVYTRRFGKIRNTAIFVISHVKKKTYRSEVTRLIVICFAPNC
jgi:hypothetical protein